VRHTVTRTTSAAGTCWDVEVRTLLPISSVAGSPSAEMTAPDLTAHYAYPKELTAPYVRVNFVSSADGAATADGRSGGLGTAADRQVFGVLRELAEVVLVGAGTVRAEGYRGARKPTRGAALPPPIAVVTGSADLDPTSPLFTDTRVPPIVLTGSAASQERRDALTAAGADVVILDPLSPEALLGELGRRGLYRVLCEGGPRLFGDFVAAGLVDELCLTVAPVLAGGDAGRIAVGKGGSSSLALSLVGALNEDDTLLLRYARTGDLT
jgi:riboflavin biosynthesis pyrimidine reductase